MTEQDKQIADQLFVTTEEIIEVGKALLPYLRNDLSHEELGAASHDAAQRLARAWKARIRTLPVTDMDGVKMAAGLALGAAEIYRNGARAGVDPIINRAKAFALDHFAEELCCSVARRQIEEERSDDTAVQLAAPDA
jgi:hypothetical protein